MLIRLVESFSGAEQGQAPVIAQPAQPTGEAATFDLDQAVRRCFGQYNMFRQMAGYFMEECDRLLAEMQHACEVNQAEAISRAAHRLKGTVFYLASDPVLQSLGVVERCAREGHVREAADALVQLGAGVVALKEGLAEHLDVPAKP